MGIFWGFTSNIPSFLVPISPQFYWVKLFVTKDSFKKYIQVLKHPAFSLEMYKIGRFQWSKKKKKIAKYRYPSLVVFEHGTGRILELLNLMKSHVL